MIHAPLRRPTKFATADDSARAEEMPKGSGVGGVFGYLRRSAEDRSGRPLYAQTEAIRAYVEKDKIGGGDGTVREFFADNGVSGTAGISLRPGLKSMVEAIDKLLDDPSHRGSVHVVVYDATRLARSPDVGSAIKKTLEERGVSLHLAASGMLVSGSSSELLFGVGLQMASSERAATISRIRNAFKYKEGEWDPRGSYGWKFNGAGTRPTPIPEEQEIIREAREMYENQGMPVAAIAKALQEKHGNRRRRDKDAPADATVAWIGNDVLKIARDGRWKSPTSITPKELGIAVEAARANGKNMEDFLEANGGKTVDGVKMTRGMLRIYFPEHLPDWRRKALRLTRAWVRNDRHSIDDIAAMLTDQAPRPKNEGGVWARQTTWDMVQQANHLNTCEEEYNALVRKAGLGAERLQQK
jgi:DNA invertase Pin-like site-specific DNA recombinase